MPHAVDSKATSLRCLQGRDQGAQHIHRLPVCREFGFKHSQRQVAPHEETGGPTPSLECKRYDEQRANDSLPEVLGSRERESHAPPHHFPPLLDGDHRVTLVDHVAFLRASLLLCRIVLSLPDYPDLRTESFPEMTTRRPWRVTTSYSVFPTRKVDQGGMVRALRQFLRTFV